VPEGQSPTKSISEEQSAPNAKNEPSKQAEAAQPPSPNASASIQPDCKIPPYHCEITCKTEKDWWDKTKPFIESAGAILLLIYTIYTIKMYCANKQAADAAASAARTANQTLQSSVDAVRLDERAWVQVSVSAPSYHINGPMTVGLHASNSGKTPSLKTTIHVATGIYSSSEKLEFVYSDFHEGHPQVFFEPFVAFKDVPYDFPVPVMNRSAKAIAELQKPVRLTQPLLADLLAQRKFMIVYGRIDYEDVFGVPHWMTFCGSQFANSIASPSETRKKCNAYNQIDNLYAAPPTH
jgi:hypothetical protein